MGSGKSLRLLASANNFEEKGIPFMCLKPSIDTRDGNFIRSRIGLERKCALIYPDTDVFKATEQYFHILENNKHESLKWILVDEAQFLTEKQVEDIAKIVDFLGINVMCYGIRTDFKTKLFPGSKRLFELADKFEEIVSSCECGQKASINARIDENGNVMSDGEQVAIDGDGAVYKPICRQCWEENMMNK
jgi:thymidine kinase